MRAGLHGCILRDVKQRGALGQALVVVVNIVGWARCAVTGHCRAS